MMTSHVHGVTRESWVVRMYPVCKKKGWIPPHLLLTLYLNLTLFLALYLVWIKTVLL